MDANKPSRKGIPLCVDLDDTLIRSDMALEGFLYIIRQNPRKIPTLLFTLFKGRSAFKAEIARNSHLNYDLLPVRKELLTWLQEQKQADRKIYLVTAAFRKEADAIANRLKIFTEVIASDAYHNIKGKNKADILLEKFGKENFEYIGDSRADIHVWRVAASGICVTQKQSFLKRHGLQDKVTVRFDRPSFSFSSVFSAIRIHQWAKNLLVFLPILSSHNWGNFPAIVSASWVALGLCFLASFVYLTNDLLDLEADRASPHKSKRPLASGALSIPFAVGLAAVLPCFSFLCAAMVPRSLEIIQIYICYAIASLGYSVKLKECAIFDILLLTGFYTFRVWVGGVATNIGTSVWLLGFAMFIFSSLALLKRYSEITIRIKNGIVFSNRRAYVADDAPFLSSWGIASGACSLLVLVLYIRSPDVIVLYRNPQFLLTLVPVLYYWLMRVWWLGAKGKMSEDPIEFALTDFQTYIVCIISMTILLWAK